MKMEVSADQVEQAITQFYGDPSGKPNLNTWLTQVQHSTQAWKFAWILLSKSKSEEVQFFAGNTVYTKVSRYWAEVPKEEYESLKIQILNYIAEFSDRKVILNRLIKALGAYILHTIEEEWPSALEDIVSMFNPETVTGLEPSTALNLLFGILMVIPDELDSCHETMSIQGSSKQKIKEILKNNSKTVLNLVQQVMQSSQVGNVTKEIVLHTLNAWLQLSLALTECHDLLISLIPYSNYGLLCESVLECLRTAVTDMSTYSLPETVMDFITQILGLRPVLEEALQSDDENTASMIYSLLTTIVESHSRLLLQSALEESKRPTVVQIVSLLVDCAAAPGQYPTQETVSSIQFAVWYTIQDDILTFDQDQCAELTELFKPVYLKLVDTFINKSLMPEDGILSGEESELFRCYRQDICDTYMYAYHVLRGDMLNSLENHLKDGVARMQRDPKDWRYLEAVLHAYSSVAETVADSDNFYVPRFIQSIPQIPFADNMQLIAVALTTLGAYADWLNFHHEHLHHVVPLMVAGLENNSLIGAASQAMRDLTLECPVTIAPFSQPILQSCQKALQKSDPPRVESAETERIITIISRVLSVGMDQRSVMMYLNGTLTPYINRIAHLKSRMGNHMAADEKQELISLIKILGCLARHLNLNNSTADDEGEDGDERQITLPQPQPLLLVLQPLMPILSEIAAKGSGDANIVQALCKMFKNSLSTLKENSLPILPSILALIPPLFEESLNSCVLDLIKSLVSLYCRDSSQEGNMGLLLQMIVTTTLSRCTSDPWTYTDVVQSCFILMASAIKKSPHLISVHQLASLFAFAMQGIKLPEEHTVKGCSSFLTSFIIFSREPNGSQFQPIVSHNVETLLRTLLFCICTCPRHSLGAFSDILTSLCKLYGDDLAQSFKLIQADPTFPPRISPVQKDEFAKRILRNRGNKRKILEAISDLALMSRGIAGTEYGHQTRGFR